MDGLGINHLNFSSAAPCTSHEIQYNSSQRDAFSRLLHTGDLTVITHILTHILTNPSQVCGHTSYVWACLFVNDALVSASADKTIRFWNVDETSYAFGESTAILTDHRDSVYALCVFPDGQRLASGSADTSILVWKPLAQKNCKIGTYTQAKCLRGHSKLVYSLVAVGPEFLASASHDWSVRIWNVATGDCLQKLDGHEEAVTCLAAFLGPHGAEAPVLFSGARDCDARIWNMLTMKCERVLSGHRDEVLCVAVLASTRKRGVLATGCEDGTINVWGIVQT
eukprot:m.251179 g.251179  ORF g.251179 m.251179 type:complete len:281 (+) comp19536_c0_seq1:1254-2096(+)